ncbi:hypothetical protein VPHK479_0069 [Vibrio phage K479]
MAYANQLVLIKELVPFSGIEPDTTIPDETIYISTFSELRYCTAIEVQAWDST